MNHYLKDFCPGNLQKPTFARFFFACCSLLAYKSTVVTEDFFLNAGFKHVKLVECDGAQAYVVNNDETIVLAFRGTEIQERSDIWADMKIWKTKGRGKGEVHSGFKGELDKVWPPVESMLNQHKDKKLYITGHSLGGAMATLAASRITTKNLEEVFTYGAPRVGNRRFARSLRYSHTRLQNNNDIICRVPSRLFGYAHHVGPTYINHYGNVRRCSSFQRFKDQLRGRWRALKKFQLFDGVYDHSLDKYCDKLHAQWLKEKEERPDDRSS